MESASFASICRHELPFMDLYMRTIPNIINAMLKNISVSFISFYLLFDHPDAVLSLDPPAPEPEKPLPSEKKKKPPKAERPAFYLTAEDARSFNYQDSYTGAELKAALIEAAGDPDVKAPTIKEIDEWLLAQRLIGMERLPTKGFYYVPTPAGVDAGLRSEDKVSARGTPYSVLLFTPEAQRMVVEHFIKPEASPSGEAVTEGD